MATPRLYVPTVHSTDRVLLPKDEAHHAARVLRLPGEAPVRIFDGKGREWSGRIEYGSKRSDVTVVIEQEVAPAAEPEVAVTLGIGVLKGDQMDNVVSDATALGVAVIVPIATAHVTVPPRAWQSGAAVERWQRVAVAAAKQCGRAVVPTVRPVAPLAEVIASRQDSIWLCAEPAVTADAAGPDERPGTLALVLVGPEGGWTEQEIETVRAAGGKLLSLGPRTLRAELAPAVALSALWSKWGWQ